MTSIFCSILWIWDPSKTCDLVSLYSWLYSRPFYRYSTVDFPFLLFSDIGIFIRFLLFWKMYHYHEFLPIYLLARMSKESSINLGVELLDCRLIPCSTLIGSAKMFPKVSIPIYTPISSVSCSLSLSVLNIFRI